LEWIARRIDTVKIISGGGGRSEEEIGTLGRRSADAMTRGKKLINDPNDVVIECIKGLVETYPKLTYLDGFPEVKVVLRADVPQGSYDRVAVISGGGSGHEPAHAGYVGEGMLTAAICGDVFASPSVNAILAVR
jgi:dihydroxyacetone kinase